MSNFSPLGKPVFRRDSTPAKLPDQSPAIATSPSSTAETLVVSEETVKTHIGNILTKLHLAHRTQAVIYALKQNLISLDEIEL